MSDQADAAFQAQARERLAALPGVQAVTLGGSRAAGTARAVRSAVDQAEALLG